MVYLTAAVIVVGVLCVLDLLLTVGVLRRLREHADLLESRAATGYPAGETVKAVGEQVGDFVATTTDGREVSRGGLVGPTLVGFFATHCPPCKESVAPFAELVAGWPGGWDQALAVVVGPVPEATRFAAEFGPGARVVVEDDRPDVASVSNGFEVMGYPAYAVVDGQGVVLAVAASLDGLPTAIPA